MTRRDRMILMVLCVGAILGAFWFLLVAPRQAESRRVDQQLAQARTQRDDAIHAFEQATAARKAARSAAAEVARLGEAVPPDDQTASLVYQLQTAAGRSHVSFDSLSLSGANGAPVGAAATPSTGTPGAAAATAAPPLPPGAVPGPAGVSILPFTLTFKGTYFGLQKFLARLHAFTTVKGDVIRVRGRLLQINSVALIAAPEGFPRIQANLNVSAYMAAPVTAAPTVAVGASTAAPTTPAAPTTSATPPTAPAAITGGAG